MITETAVANVLKCSFCHEKYTVAEALPVTLGHPNCSFVLPPVSPPVFVPPPPPKPLPAELIERGFTADRSEDNGEYWANLDVNDGLYVVVYHTASHCLDQLIYVMVDDDMGGYENRCGVREGETLELLLPFIDALIAVLKS